ncbi:MAG: TonB-dependent receptor, partial [Sphingobium sp.]
SAAINYSRGDVNAALATAEPALAFGERNRERVRQFTPGLAYELRWKGDGSQCVGIKRAYYSKQVYVPGVATTATQDHSWLFNASVALDLGPRIALYASASSGLEESGIAPDSAANRREVLPAIHTQQVDAGVRMVLPLKLRLVAGLFNVRKPYFAVDPANIYAESGRIRHRGVELSLTGTPAPGLTMVGGAVLMDPTVSGPQVDKGLIGRVPLGDTARILSLSLNYAVPLLPGFTLGTNIFNHGSRTADTLNRIAVPAATTIDVSARYRLQIGGQPALLRFQINNLTDRLDYAVLGNNSFGFSRLRSFAFYLTIDT